MNIYQLKAAILQANGGQCSEFRAFPQLWQFSVGVRIFYAIHIDVRSHGGKFPFAENWALI